MFRICPNKRLFCRFRFEARQYFSGRNYILQKVLSFISYAFYLSRRNRTRVSFLSPIDGIIRQRASKRNNVHNTQYAMLESLKRIRVQRHFECVCVYFHSSMCTHRLQHLNGSCSFCDTHDIIRKQNGKRITIYLLVS